MRFDERIHRFTWEASGNPYLAETLERYFTHSLRIWYLVLDRLPGLGHAVHDQAHLLEALLAGDAGPRALDHARARARLPARAARRVQPELRHLGTRMFIDGEWCDAASGATVEATSPATGESLGPVAEGEPRGRTARDRRRRTPRSRPGRRAPASSAAALLHRVADVCERRARRAGARRSRSTRASRSRPRPRARSAS